MINNNNNNNNNNIFNIFMPCLPCPSILVLPTLRLVQVLQLALQRIKIYVMLPKNNENI